MGAVDAGYVWGLRCVYEDGLLDAMGVNVEKEAQVFDVFFHITLNQVYFEALIVFIFPKTPIHILTLQISTIVANNHTIWIHHRTDPPSV